MQRDITRALTLAARGATITPRIDSARLSAQGSTAGSSFRARFAAAARLEPTVNTSGLASQGSAAGRAFGERFSSSAKLAMATVGIGAGVAGLASQFKQVMSVGMDWTRTMNTFTAVTGASADELKKAGDAARALGNDVSLPATSANDAAAAMTELAKGGFTVQQSMDAAKGSLQLAAAAGISATDAATIQSQALQAFGLDAKQAGKMSDTLANAANASSAEITDVAYALQASGTVANQFGLSAQDTAAAIALLANNGIKGSDAGTLLKTSLLALTDQGKPAQAAIKELGLTVYDAQGKFVGLHELYGQLGAAAKRMTPEEYQAASAVLFGSDAMRIAGVAAKDGSASYDQMRVAIDRQGAAADVAAAKTKGMPGALERVKNAVESLQLKAYDALQNPISKLLDQVSAGLGEAEDAATAAGPKVAAAWKQLTANPAVQSTWRESLALLASLGTTAARLWPSLQQIGQSLAKASAALGVSSWKVLVTALEAAAGVLNSLMPLIKGTADFMSSHQAVVTAAAGAWLLFRTVPSIMGRIVGTTVPVTTAMSNLGRTITGASGPLVPLRTRLTAIVGDFRNIGTAAQNNGQHLSNYSRLMTSLSNNSQTVRNMTNAFIGASTASGGAAAALRAGLQPAISGVRGAASGLIGALGGPFSVALMAAGAAFLTISQQNQKADQSLQAYHDAVRRTERAQVNLNAALGKSRGAFDDSVKGTAVDRIAAIGDEFDAASKKTGSFWDGFRDAGRHSNWDATVGFAKRVSSLGIFDVKESEKGQREAEGRAASAAKKALDDLKMSNEQLADSTYGSQAAFDAMVSKLDATGQSGRDAAQKLREARTEFINQQQIASTTAPGVLEMAKAMRTLADNTASAADKTSALKTAMDALNPARTAGDAEAAHTKAAEAAKQAEVQIDPSKGIGGNLFKANGQLDTALPNAVDLREKLKGLADTTAEVGAKSGDMTAALAKNEETFTSLAQQYKADVGAIKGQYAELGGTLADVSGQLSAVAKKFQDGSIPTDHPINVTAPGGQEVLDLLKGLGEKVHADNDKNIKVDAPLGDKTRQLLEKLGYAVRTDNDKLIIVKTNADQAKAELDKLKSTIVVPVEVRTPAFVPAVPGETRRPTGGGRADGAIVLGRLFGAIAMADGGLRQIRKPQSADIYAGRGAGTVFAEEETGGEAYIPLASSKRPRSLAILAEVARRFGVGLTAMADGGITVDELKSFASNIAGNSYNWGGGNGDTFSTDCSGAQSTIANFLTGGSGRFATGTESSELLKRGFQAGDPPDGVAAYWVGWENGGQGGGHTAGTIVDPDGGNVNVEMGGKKGGGQYGGGAAGASSFPNRAWIALAGGDNGKTTGGGASASQVMSAQASVRRTKASSAKAQQDLDEANAELNSAPNDKKRKAAEKKRDNAQRRLDAATDRQAVAEQKLSEVLNKKSKGTEKSAGGDGGVQSFGQSLVSGLLQGIGLDGSVFSNPLEWPNVKSGLALLNWGAGYAKAWANPDGVDGQGADGNGGPLGGALSSLGLPNLAPSTEPKNLQPIGAAGTGTGPLPGPAQAGDTFNVSGVNPREIMPKIDARQWAATSRHGMGAK